MPIQKTLRTALVTLGLFSAAIAGHAHQQPENISKLLNAPVAQQAVQAPDLAKLAKSFLSNPSDKTNLAQVAGQFKMAPDMMAVSMEKTVNMLKLHLQPAEQETALQSMMASSFDQKEKAQTLLKQLPVDNVITSAVSQVLEFQALLSSPANWTAFSLEMWKMPKFNVQHTLAEPGVKTLQSLLENKCAIPKTSLPILESNVECADASSNASKIVTMGLMESKLTDGLIVGEYEGIPVLVMHDSAGANGTAGVFRMNAIENRPATPFIVISLDLANQLQGKPGALTFILEHELGHVAHNHVMGDTDNNEIPADLSAVQHMSGKGMSVKEIAAAYSQFEQATLAVLPKSVLSAPGFVKMMTDRHNSVEKTLQTIQNQDRSSAFAHNGYGS